MANTQTPWTPTSRPGRQKGAVNVTTAVARQGIAKVYQLLGGEKGLWDWARANARNKSVFYAQLLPRLIPAEIADSHGVGDKRIEVILTPAPIPTEVKTITVKPLDEQGGDLSAGGGGY